MVDSQAREVSRAKASPGLLARKLALKALLRLRLQRLLVLLRSLPVALGLPRRCAGRGKRIRAESLTALMKNEVEVAELTSELLRRNKPSSTKKKRRA